MTSSFCQAVITSLCLDTVSAHMVVGHLLSPAHLPGTHWVMICVIRRLALTVSDVCLKLSCFQSTSTYSALEVLHFMLQADITREAPHCRVADSRTHATDLRSSWRWQRRWMASHRRSRPCWPTLCPEGTQWDGRRSYVTEWREDWWWGPALYLPPWTACPRTHSKFTFTGWTQYYN